MEIRKAQWHELDQVVSLGRAFFDTTEWAKDVTFDPEATRQTLTGLMFDPRGTLLVAVEAGRVIAMVGIQIAPIFFGRDLMATELFWYVDEAYRGAKVSGPLFLEAEAWAKQAGASVMLMGSLVSSPPFVRGMYERAGYRESQTAFIRRL